MAKRKPENIVLAVHGGRDGAVGRLVVEYQDRLYGYALRLLRNHFDAQEVTQDAFLNAIHALSTKYDAEKCRNLRLDPWLFRITRNLAYNRLRKRQPDEVVLPEPSEGETFLPSRPAVAIERLEALENRRKLMKALGLMGTGARELIVLRFVEELSYAEIAVIVGAGESAVRGRVFRALRALRELLASPSRAGEGSHSHRRSTPRRMKARGLKPALTKLST